MDQKLNDLLNRLSSEIFHEENFHATPSMERIKTAMAEINNYIGGAVMSLSIEFDFESDETLRCKGKPNTDKSKEEGEYFGNVVVKDTRWAIVLWDNEEDPNLHKTSCLLLEKKEWVPL